MAPSKLSWFRSRQHVATVDDKKAKQSQHKPKEISSSVLERQIPADQPGSVAMEHQPAVTSIVHQAPALSTSQRLWNEAYDSLESDKDTAGLTKAYIKAMMTVLMPENAAEATASEASDVSIELKDPVIRQMNMKRLVEAGQAKVSKVSKITSRVGDVAQFILSVKGMVDLAIQNIPQAALPWAGVCIGLQILLNPVKATKSNLAGITHVVSRMDWYCNLTEHLLNKDHTIIGNVSFESTLLQLEKRIVALYRALLLYQMKSVCSYYRNQGLVLLRGLANLDDWDGDLKGVMEAETAVQKDSDQYNNVQAKSLLGKLVKDGEARQSLLGDVRQALWEYIALQKDIHVDEKNTKCLNELRVVDPQADMQRIENSKDKLLDKAYEWIIYTSQYTAFTNWDNEDTGSLARRLLWINGPAGTGKTMLLIGIIRGLSDRSFKLSPKLSYFFCQGTDKALNNATATLRSLIWMLIIQQPHLISYLQTAYHHSGEALFKDINVFYALSTVFQNMLRDPSLSPTYFIIDALDECDQVTPGVTELIDLISTSLALTDKVRWLLSSRPIFDGHTKLRKLAASETLLELDTESLEGPVNAYIDHKLSTLIQNEGYDEETLTMIASEIRQRAMNTFLWVALVFKELDRGKSWEAVEIVQSIPSGLSDLYGHLMDKIESGSRKTPQYCKNVLVATSLAYRPLTLSELGVLADLPPKSTSTIVEICGSFLTIRQNMVYLIHQSAKDYLDENHKSRLQPGGAVQSHADISRRSITAMSSTLKVNIYGLSQLGVWAKNTKPPDPDPLACLRYSCVFWINHLCEVDNRISDHGTELSDTGASFAFLKEHFLHWLESLSLIYKLSDGVLSIKKLLRRVQPQSTTSPQFAGFLEDSEKFILNYRPIIEQAPLQTYGAALGFCPTRSKVKSQYWKERLSFIKDIRGIREDWDPCRQILEGHSDRIWAVAFSPDGKVLASASDDKTIRLWDAAMGTWKQTLEGHSGVVWAVAFSPDGKVLASASDDKTVRLWDAATGTWKQTLEGHSDTIRALAFSPDGKVLASASNDKTIRLWDAATGTWKQTLEGHDESISAVAFSPNGKVLASASFDRTVRLWDTATRTWEQTLEGYNEWVWAVAFSPDGKVLTFASDDKTVRLWDTATGTWKQTLEGHSGAVRAVAFSPDGRVLASASNDATIRLWDTATGTWKQTLEGHNSAVWAVAFSPDGKVLASASYDKTIRLWDTATRTWKQTLEGHRHWVNAVTFSPDGKIVASASDDLTVRLWDPAMGTWKQTLEGHSERISAVAFSPDGKVLASASNDKTIRLWDAVTGTWKQTLEGHDEWISAVAFSPDGKVLASASYDKTIRLWDAVTGIWKQTLEGHNGSVRAIGFLSDGKVLASASSDKTVRLWDAATGAWKQTLETNVTERSLLFSEDGHYLKTGQWLFSLNSASDDTRPHQKQSTCAIFVNKEWITQDGQNVLWLPPDYRAVCSALYNNMLVLGHASGRVTFLEFAIS